MAIFLHRHVYYSIILVLLITLLATCSSTRLIYSFMEKFIRDEITYFFDLDDDDEIFLSQQVSETVAWHRISMLPSYAVYLTNIAHKLEVGEYSNTDITKIVTNARSLIEETVTGLTPYASKFLIRHQTIEAIEFIEKRMVMRRQERLEKLLKPEDILYEQRLERLKLNFGRFFGDLNDSQLILLEAYARETLYDSITRLDNRTLRQKILIIFLRSQPTEAELTAYLNKLLLRGHLITNPAYEAFSEKSLKRFRQLLVNMLAISSTKQREKIVSKLRDYAEDFESIAKN